MLLLPTALLLLVQPPQRAPLGRISCSAPQPPAVPSLRQRLRETHVDPQLLAEVSAVVTHRKNWRPRGPGASQQTAVVAPPLVNPFGSKPRFVASASTLRSLPPESLPEVAFIGRSNVGKSSLLNALTGVSSLAKVSDKPGRTQALNFFELGRKDSAFAMVDMPGYGFAFAKDEDVAAWRELSASYLQSRKTLKLVLVLLDAKVGLKSNDLQMLSFLEACRLKYTIVFTKADAAGSPERTAQMVSLALESVKRSRHFVRPAALVSSRTGAGIGRLQRRLLETATGRDPMKHVDGGWAVPLARAVPTARGRGRAPGRGSRGTVSGSSARRGRGGRRGAVRVRQ